MRHLCSCSRQEQPHAPRVAAVVEPAPSCHRSRRTAVRHPQRSRALARRRAPGLDADVRHAIVLLGARLMLLLPAMPRTSSPDRTLFYSTPPSHPRRFRRVARDFVELVAREVEMVDAAARPFLSPAMLDVPMSADVTRLSCRSPDERRTAPARVPGRETSPHVESVDLLYLLLRDERRRQRLGAAPRAGALGSCRGTCWVKMPCASGEKAMQSMTGWLSMSRSCGVDPAQVQHREGTGGGRGAASRGPRGIAACLMRLFAAENEADTDVEGSSPVGWALLKSGAHGLLERRLGSNRRRQKNMSDSGRGSCACEALVEVR